MNVSIVLLRRFHLRRFLTWDSWSGFGVSMNWPDGNWEEQLRELKQIFQCYLPKDWITQGPCFAAGGVLVMYAWPRSDPNVKEIAAGLDNLKMTVEECIEEIKKVSSFVGLAKVER